MIRVLNGLFGWLWVIFWLTVIKVATVAAIVVVYAWANLTHPFRRLRA